MNVQKFGSRKWLSFLLMVAVTVLFVMEKRITDQAVIRDILLGLMGVYGLANVGAAYVARSGANPGPPGPKTIAPDTRQ